MQDVQRLESLDVPRPGRIPDEIYSTVAALRAAFTEASVLSLGQSKGSVAGISRRVREYGTDGVPVGTPVRGVA